MSALIKIINLYKSDDVAMRRLHEPMMDYAITGQQMQQIKDALDSAGIYQYRSRIEANIARALGNAIDYTNHSFKPYAFKKLTKLTFGTARVKGPHRKELIRMQLIHALFLAWRHAFGSEPTISRKITAKDQWTVRSPFVVFATEILAIAHIGKPEDHLTLYRSYENAVHRGLSYQEWIDERAQLRAARMAN